MLLLISFKYTIPCKCCCEGPNIKAQRTKNVGNLNQHQVTFRNALYLLQEITIWH